MKERGRCKFGGAGAWPGWSRDLVADRSRSAKFTGRKVYLDLNAPSPLPRYHELGYYSIFLQFKVLVPGCSFFFLSYFRMTKDHVLQSIDEVDQQN